ncbi:TetR/AcrR family transcriptional regulator [Gryllotalpicola protaetiae]|uniref:TetR/AcrR family transcriptional regulator n=1 Tax=Gryllotalpicola protaetiae TaxID=2419771 RepID=A0A387BSM8_9MICO|nr:TetR/AcrR family transcriptional regulator [Gryllotalpicola protaetiae]AYG03947.1 TetR/AcrR family transcriptional regulator [Gryllotalpicola protaetiae]
MKPGQKTAKGTATRARIIETAARVMFENGVAETSVEQVCSAARVNASQVYHYFGDKRGLIAAVVDFQSQRLGPAGRLDSMVELRAWARERVEQQRGGDAMGGCAYGSLAGQLGTGHPEFREQLVDGFGGWLARVESGLEAMHRRGELVEAASPHELAIGLLAATQGGMLLAVVTQSSESLEIALDQALDRIAALTPQAGRIAAA